jgi:hypothetical protein
LYRIVTAFPLRSLKVSDPTAFVICGRTQTPSLGVLGDSTTFFWQCHGYAGVLHGDLVTIRTAVGTPP